MLQLRSMHIYFGSMISNSCISDIKKCVLSGLRDLRELGARKSSRLEWNQVLKGSSQFRITAESIIWRPALPVVESVLGESWEDMSRCFTFCQLVLTGTPTALITSWSNLYWGYLCMIPTCIQGMAFAGKLAASCVTRAFIASITRPDSFAFQGWSASLPEKLMWKVCVCVLILLCFGGLQTATLAKLWWIDQK